MRAYEVEISAMKATNEEQSRNAAETKVEMDGLEKERDFYFDKLRDIEILLQDMEDNGKGNEHTASIFKILYATAEGFEPIDEAAMASALANSSEASFLDNGRANELDEADDTF